MSDENKVTKDSEVPATQSRDLSEKERMEVIKGVFTAVNKCLDLAKEIEKTNQAEMKLEEEKLKFQTFCKTVELKHKNMEINKNLILKGFDSHFNERQDLLAILQFFMDQYSQVDGQASKDKILGYISSIATQLGDSSWLEKLAKVQVA
ncbi:MAG: hypothetical protein KC478_16660 [Bacteriovoracaceae bacterium]|nr:hypothetical protein [Bacteriovoracaceae bacterium]